MGSASAMSSIERVVQVHGKEIQQEYAAMLPEMLRHHFVGVTLESNTYDIQVYWVFEGQALLEGPRLDIDSLAERYPDCEVGY